MRKEETILYFFVRSHNDKSR